MSSVCEDKMRNGHVLKRSHSLDGMTTLPLFNKAILSWHMLTFRLWVKVIFVTIHIIGSAWQQCPVKPWQQFSYLFCDMNES